MEKEIIPLFLEDEYSELIQVTITDGLLEIGDLAFSAAEAIQIRDFITQWLDYKSGDQTSATSPS